MTNQDFEKWEKEVEIIKKDNTILFNKFKKHLEKKGLKPKTIKNHISNIEFFATHFLLRYDATPVEEGSWQIESFLGDYFIRKTTWASKTSINENIASFKKFYGFLYEMGKISREDLGVMKLYIEEGKKEWIEAAESYYGY